MRKSMSLVMAAGLAWSIACGAWAQGTAPAQTEPKAEPAKTEPAKSAPEVKAEKAKLEYVSLTTSLGEIVLELNAEKAPVTVANFLSYVDKGHYAGTVFHRVMPGFMIQGGGFDAEMKERPTGAGIKNEGRNGLKNVRGSIAMARRNDPDSATAQFFINVVDNPGLDAGGASGAGYAVFGKVIGGMETVDRIRELQTGTRGIHQNVPNELPTITAVTRLTRDEAMAKSPDAKPSDAAPADKPAPKQPDTKADPAKAPAKPQ